MYDKICDASELVGDSDVMVRNFITGIWQAWG
jgi:hypothetical protein